MLEMAEMMVLYNTFGENAEKNNYTLHYSLRRFLEDMETLCSCVGGQIVSRQTVALAVATWKLHNPKMVPYQRKYDA